MESAKAISIASSTCKRLRYTAAMPVIKACRLKLLDAALNATVTCAAKCSRDDSLAFSCAIAFNTWIPSNTLKLGQSAVSLSRLEQPTNRDQ
eukprot:1546119-Amphidinium_carterae.1